MIIYCKYHELDFKITPKKKLQHFHQYCTNSAENTFPNAIKSIFVLKPQLSAKYEFMRYACSKQLLDSKTEESAPYPGSPLVNKKLVMKQTESNKNP